MNHTPTPWKIDRLLTANAAPVIVAETCWRNQARTVAKALYHSGSEDPEVQANAKFIVRACNCHDELLDIALTFLGVAYWMGLDKTDDWNGYCEKIKAAISKAEGV
jgi:hypothetical protein